VSCVVRKINTSPIINPFPFGFVFLLVTLFIELPPLIYLMKINLLRNILFTVMLFYPMVDNFSQQFTEKTDIILPGISRGSVEWGDYDNDNDLDILITGRISPSQTIVRVFRNDGNNNFSAQNDIFSPQITQSFRYEKCSSVWRDMNNDGFIDILLNYPSESGENKLLVYGNKGNGTFELKTTLSYVTMDDNSMDPGDFDNDGDEDIFVTTLFGSKIYQNNGGFTFTEMADNSFKGLYRTFCRWIDYDNDSDLDLFLAGANISGEYSNIYQNQGNNRFLIQNDISLRGFVSGSGEWGDYNNDGFQDLLIASGNATLVCKNNGDNTFTEKNEFTLKAVRDGFGKWGDIDNDGDLDILISGNYNTGTYITVIYINNGDDSFTELTGESIIGSYDSSGDLGDYDNDGDLDLLIAGNTGTAFICKIYRNNAASSNPVPASPSGLSSEQQGSSILLKWEKVTTDNSSASSLSYNLKVGSTSGAIDILSPNASDNGYRRFSFTGNAGTNTKYILKNLEKGDYHWSVQAVDNGMAGGSFSSESTFTYSQSFQAYGLSVTDTGATEVTLSWRRGNGDNCLVFVKEGNSGSAFPENNQTYLASSIFASGSQLGSTGWYCIYKGSDNSARVTGLKAKTGYLFRVIEFEGNPGTEMYYDHSDEQNPLFFTTGIFTRLTNANLIPVYNTGYFGEQRSRTIWSDFDNDNDLDLLLSGQGITYIYRNDLNGIFSLLDQHLSSGNSASVGDFNNDGYNDVIITNSSRTILYTNNHDNTFTEQTEAVLTGGFYGTVETGDLDNDGFIDVIISAQNEQQERFTKIFRNNGDTSFTERITVSLPPLNAGSVDLADYDNDGFKDLFLTGHTSTFDRVSKLYRNDQQGNFTEVNDILFKGVYFGTADWSDYDNDGDPDLLYSGFADEGAITVIYRNENGKSFTLLEDAGLKGIQYGSCSWGDYDNDGDPDILMAGFRSGYYPVTIIYKNDNGIFTEEKNSSFTGIGYTSIAWGDFDNNGDPDIAITGISDNGPVSEIYRNDLGNDEVVLLTPSLPMSKVNMSDVTLSWNMTTGKRSHTFNIRVGTKSGGVDIVSPHSSKSGYRRVAAMGNNGYDTTILLRKMKPGKYFWSVQSVDKGFNGSAFSEEGTFEVIPVQAGNLSAMIMENNNLLLKWNRGSGDRVVVLCKMTSSGQAYPVNGMGYIADNEYGYGGQIGSTGWYCVYNGRNDSVIISGLTREKEYSFHVIEYTGTFGSEEYFTTSSDGNPGVFSISQFSAQKSIGIPPSIYNNIVWGDYDNDGFLDYILPGRPTRIYHNKGNNTFSTPGIDLPDFSDGSAEWGDYDNDGDLDLLITGGSKPYPTSNPVSKIYRNDGDSVFMEQSQIILAPVQFSSVAWGDYDNDDDLDILLSGATGNEPDFNPVTKVYKNNGDGTFSEQTQLILTGIYKGAVSWIDYDNDGDLDIFLAGIHNPAINAENWIYRNDGYNTFTFQSDLKFWTGSQVSADWGDFDNDSDQDLVLASWGNFNIYQNEGGNSFKLFKTVYYNAVNRSGCAVWGDYNNDGYLDLITSHPYLSTHLYKNNNGTEFIDQKVESIVNSGYSHAAWGDYDNDGDLDFIAATGDINGTLFRNNLIMKSGSFEPSIQPESPIGLTSKSTPDGIELNWIPAYGTFGQKKSNSYNVKIWKITGSGNILPSHSDSTGYRKIVKLGNAGCDTVYFLKNVQSGDYYWSVQSVNNSFNGSKWAGYESFSAKDIYPDFNSDTVCQGTTTTFTDLSVSNIGLIDSWKWDFGDGSSSMLRNPVNTYSLPGEYEVTLTVSKGDDSYSKTKKIFVKPVPHTGFRYVFNEQNRTFVTFSNTSDTNNLNISTWSWDFGDGYSSTLKNPPAHGYSEEGLVVVTLSIMSENGCTDTTKAEIMICNEALEKPQIIAYGPNVWYMTCSNKTAKIYRWYIDNKIIEGANSNFYMANQKFGTYKVEISDKGYCFIPSDEIKIPTGITGIEDPDPFEDVKIYPNPTTGMFAIEMNNNVFGELVIDIITQNGSKVLNIKFEKTTEHFQTQIDLSGQSKGMYLINLSLDKFRAVKKVLVE
jgi:PKD repeat protein/predicted nucleotidyltransferase